MTLALYATIWMALALFVAGEDNKRRERDTQIHRPWTVRLWGVGAILACVHSLVALGVVYDWDHARAVQVTAERAADVYGVAWRGSLFVNYAFLAWWLVDVRWWWRHPRGYFVRARTVEWCWRIVAFVMLANGAIVFASPTGRLAGAPLIALLLLVWWKDRVASRS
jgi:hypothetical protein